MQRSSAFSSPSMTPLMTKACALSELAGPQEKIQCVVSTAYLVVFWDAKWQWQCYLKEKRKSFHLQKSDVCSRILPYVISPFPIPIRPK